MISQPLAATTVVLGLALVPPLRAPPPPRPTALRLSPRLREPKRPDCGGCHRPFLINRRLGKLIPSSALPPTARPSR